VAVNHWWIWGPFFPLSTANITHVYGFILLQICRCGRGSTPDLTRGAAGTVSPKPLTGFGVLCGETRWEGERNGDKWKEKWKRWKTGEWEGIGKEKGWEGKGRKEGKMKGRVALLCLAPPHNSRSPTAVDQPWTLYLCGTRVSEQTQRRRGNLSTNLICSIQFWKKCTVDSLIAVSAPWGSSTGKFYFHGNSVHRTPRQSTIPAVYFCGIPMIPVAVKFPSFQYSLSTTWR